jgi:hypothetical protein
MGSPAKNTELAAEPAGADYARGRGVAWRRVPAADGGLRREEVAQLAGVG